MFSGWLNTKYFNPILIKVTNYINFFDLAEAKRAIF
jgi:hypothetical protein